MSEILVVIEREGDAWGAYCPDLPGVGVVGASRDQVEERIRETLTLHLDAMRKGGEPIPPPTAVASAMVEVPAG